MAHVDVQDMASWKSSEENTNMDGRVIAIQELLQEVERLRTESAQLSHKAEALEVAVEVLRSREIQDVSSHLGPERAMIKNTLLEVFHNYEGSLKTRDICARAVELGHELDYEDLRAFLYSTEGRGLADKVGRGEWMLKANNNKISGVNGSNSARKEEDSSDSPY